MGKLVRPELINTKRFPYESILPTQDANIRSKQSSVIFQSQLSSFQ